VDIQILNRKIKQNGWLEVPAEIMTREGNVAKTSGDTWYLPQSYRSGRIDFSFIENDVIKWVTKRRAIIRAETTSIHAAVQEIDSLRAEFLSKQNEFRINAGLEINELKARLINLVESSISSARSSHRLWALYRPIQWYIWCADNFPELGFCPAYAMELDGMVIPGNPKGEAVRSDDPDRGPLHRSLELPLLINAMRNDHSNELKHLQQKAAVALSIALGRNSANLTYLRESDLVNLTPESEESCYIVRVPRIKKRQLNPRDDLLDEYLDSEFAGYLKELIKANKKTSMVVNALDVVENDRPLFVRSKKNKTSMLSDLKGHSYNMTSAEISRLLQAFVKRHNIISPLTHELLHISTRRLRYTLATSLAAEGISKRELARILDHTDTQHVQVYFELAGNIVEHLDKATAKGFAKYLNYFKGRVIDDDRDAINGDRDDKHLAFIDETDPADQTEIGICGEGAICHLDPPFSCYLCPKFQPYKHADHEHVLDRLLAGRETRMEKYDNARLGIQLDQVIVAVAQVAEQCKQEMVNA